MVPRGPQNRLPGRLRVYKDEVHNALMECFQERERFLYKYKDHLDFVLLTANKSVSDKLIRDTYDLPWNLDADGERKPIPQDYMQQIITSHTAQDQYDWWYIASACSPFWTWDSFGDSLDEYMSRWPEKFGKWFFSNWSHNPSIMKISSAKIENSLLKYIYATKIKRTFKRCVTIPTHPMCKSRLLHEFNALRS